MNTETLSTELFVIALIVLGAIAVGLSAVLAYAVKKVGELISPDFAESLADTVLLGAKELATDLLQRTQATADKTDNKLDDFVVEQLETVLKRNGYILATRDDGTPAIIPEGMTDETTNSTLDLSTE